MDLSRPIAETDSAGRQMCRIVQCNNDNVTLSLYETYRQKRLVQVGDYLQCVCSPPCNAVAK